MAVAVKTIKNMIELIQFVNATDGLYVRHSRFPQKDIDRGFSVNWANNSRETGISVNTLYQGDADEDQMANLCQVIHMYESKGLTCWIASGERCGTGSDNEPTLEEVTMVARISRKCLNEALAWNMVSIYKWPTAAEKAMAQKVVARLRAALAA
jgi:hypothetical protein